MGASALGAGEVGVAQARSNAKQSSFNNLLNLGGLGVAGYMAYAMSDRRVKKDIKKVGETRDGLAVYTYKFKGHPTTEMGVMAQDVEKVKPDAVKVLPSGIKVVDYSKIGHRRKRKETNRVRA